MNNRPRIKVPYEQADILVELVNITLLILIWGFTIVHYLDLPDTIPIHFNARGEADGFGHKSTIWMLPAIATFIYLLMIIINLFPHTHNYMVNITEDNALKNYRLSTRVLRLVNLFCMILFAVLVYEIMSLSIGKNTNVLGWEIIVLSFLAPISLVVYAIIKQKQINRE